MTHFYERIAVDAKKIYTDYLIDIITPSLYEGFHIMYKEAMSVEQNFITASKSDPNIKNPSIMHIFQHFLREVENISATQIENELKRVRTASGCADIFDDLVRATIKSHIIVLTYMNDGKKSKLVEEKFHERIDIAMFVHGCYFECAKLIYDHPLLFFHQFPNNELKENQRTIFQLLKVGVRNAIHRVLPMKIILEEYLDNDYLPDERYLNTKDLLYKDKHETDEGGRMMLVDSTDTTTTNHHDLLKLEQHDDDFAALVYGRNIQDTIDDNIDPKDPKDPKEERHGGKTPEVVEDNKNNDHIDPHSNTHKSEKVVSHHSDTAKKYEDMEKMLAQQGGKGKRNMTEKILMDQINVIKHEHEHEHEHENSDQINVVRGKYNKLDDKSNFFNDMLN
jgi:hypothetical protein